MIKIFDWLFILLTISEQSSSSTQFGDQRVGRRAPGLARFHGIIGWSLCVVSQSQLYSEVINWRNFPQWGTNDGKFAICYAAHPAWVGCLLGASDLQLRCLWTVVYSRAPPPLAYWYLDYWYCSWHAGNMKIFNFNWLIVYKVIPEHYILFIYRS